jgi:predicted RNase H-like nuclease
MRLGFGLDLAGYSTGKSALAVAEVLPDWTVHATILDHPCFSRRRKLEELRHAVEREEQEALAQLLHIAPTAVDVPIDLQGLPTISTSEYLWGQVKRPIDKAVGGLPPFADKIGAVVSRFASLAAKPDIHAQLGSRLFETYPAACLSRMGWTAKGYKGDKAREVLAGLIAQIGMRHDGMNDDELDAVICALVAVAPEDAVLEGTALQSALLSAGMTAPTGYRLLSRKYFGEIRVERDAFDSWSLGVKHA